MVQFLDSLGLNSAQRSAVEHDGGSQLVFAGAGTGKTRVLTSKIAWLIKEKGVHPANIFAATFTNKAAKEMKERVSALIGIPCDSLWIGTFHSLCVRILRREAERLGYTRWFTIYDTTDQQALIKSVMKEAMVDEKTLQPKSVLGIISSYKNRTLTPDDVESRASSFYERELAELYRRYQEGLKRADAMDFDDLIGQAVHLFRAFPLVALDYQRLFHHVLVDEYQDTNGAQFELVKGLAGESNPVFAVGDDDQSIYGWRGAQIENILSFEERFGNTTIFKLEQNYRSTQRILDFSNAVIGNNKRRSDKKLWSNISGGDDVLLRAYSDDRKEAESISREIDAGIAGGSVAPGDIAVLFRTNAQSRLFEDQLRKRNVPYVLVGGTSFYERKEIKDVLAYLKLLVNPRDEISCQRILNVPTRGIGAKSQEKIAYAAREQGIGFFEIILSGGAEGLVKGKAGTGLKQFREIFQTTQLLVSDGETPESIVTELLTLSGYLDDLNLAESEENRERVENINELINAIAEWQSDNREKGLREFLEEITLASDVDGWEKGTAVSLMTLHSSKGLEFDRIYLVGAEDGILPSKQNIDDFEKLEEECRLFYVGATRAQQQLVVSYAESRMRFGSVMPMGPSRFLKAVPGELYRLVDETARFTTVSWDEEAQASSHRRERIKTTGTSGKRVIKRGAPALMRGSDFLPQNKPKTESLSATNSGVGGDLRMGQRVEHAKFGVGKIMNLSGFGPDRRVTVLFEGGLRKQLMAKFAKLKVL